MRIRWTSKSKTTKTPKTKLRPAVEEAAPVDAVAGYKGWTASGQTLADARSAQVTDPLSNPDTVGQLREAERSISVQAIEAHRRRSAHRNAIEARLMDADVAAVGYRIDGAIADTEHARAQLGRIRTAREANSPAVAAADMVAVREKYRKRYMGVSYVASSLAAVGLGADAWNSGLGVPMSVTAGVLGEITLTFLLGQIVAGQAELDQRDGLARDADGTKIDTEGIPKWFARLPWLGAAGVLLASIGINTHGVVTGTGVLGVLGVFGALVAALTAFLSWGYSKSASARVASLLRDHRIASSEDDLAEIASGVRIPRHTTGVDRDAVLDAVAADPRLLDAVLADAAERATAEVPQPPAIPAPRPPVDYGEVETDTGDRGGVALAEREGLAEGARASAAEAIANRNRVHAARLELIKEGDADPSVSAIAKRAGVSRRTVNRHLGN